MNRCRNATSKEIPADKHPGRFVRALPAYGAEIDTADTNQHSVPNNMSHRRCPGRRRGARHLEEISCTAAQASRTSFSTSNQAESILEQPARAEMPLTDSSRADRREDAQSATRPSRRMLCRIDGLADLTHNMRELRLAIEDGGPFGFRAGQYAQIEFAPNLRRFYSMASMPAEEPLVFHLRSPAAGETSSYVASQLKPADRVQVSGPMGSAYLRDWHAGPVLLVAGGSGLAPMLSILRSLLARDAGARVMLYIGVRGERDIYREPMLAGLAATHGNFSYEIVLSEPDSGTKRRQGQVHEAVARDLADATSYTAYLAGPPAMVDAAGRLLLGRGVQRPDLHADAFRQSPSEG
jgi:naphthalene 1,2-dioxygenase ferredoxin reductase component